MAAESFPTQRPPDLFVHLGSFNLFSLRETKSDRPTVL